MPLQFLMDNSLIISIKVWYKYNVKHSLILNTKCEFNLTILILRITTTRYQFAIILTYLSSNRLYITINIVIIYHFYYFVWDSGKLFIILFDENTIYFLLLFKQTTHDPLLESAKALESRCKSVFTFILLFIDCSSIKNICLWDL